MAYIEPRLVFNLEAVSIMMILTVMLGGAGTLWGPVLGATVYVILAEVFRTIPGVKEVHVLVFALIVILIIMFLPDGILGEWDKIRRIFIKPKQAV
jgi:branched-chain amino acid transport system permease protein